jgi:hypothetical protein
MKMNTKNLLILTGILLLAAVGLWALTGYFLNLPDHVSQHETHVVGQNRFEPGSDARIRIIVRDSSDGAPLPDSEVKVSLEAASGGGQIDVFQGVTDSNGIAEINFPVPVEEQGEPFAFTEASLIIDTESDLGKDQLVQPITIEREFRILITTDKPIYQPGQTILVRALALSTFDLSPASNQQLGITIADGKGNKVFRESLTTSEYGVASIEFPLATEVNTGNYKISVSMGETTSEKTVEVKYYVLPKFAISLETESTYYMPGDRLHGAIQSDYFFGKSVGGGKVLIEAYTFDVERQDFARVTGITDDSGRFEFDLVLPDFIVGTDLESGLGTVYLQASVTDQTDHTETSNRSLLISENPLIIEAVPESGQLRLGVENILYVMTSLPDGTPVETELTVEINSVAQNAPIREVVQTDRYGMAEVRFLPDDRTHFIIITATAANGLSVEKSFDFVSDSSLDEYVLLRPERPIYRVGETMDLTFLSSERKGTVYLDIVRQGQTLSTRSIQIGEDSELGPGMAALSVDISPDLYGTLELHAYKILPSGIISRDTRLIVVDAAVDLNLRLDLDQETYLPGDTAKLNIQVSDNLGIGKQALLGLSIVDESVFVVAESDPGFAKLYFMLESELLQPRYDLHDYQVGDLVTQESTLTVETELQDARENAAFAAMADAVMQNVAFSLQHNTRESNIQNLRHRQVGFFAGLVSWSYLLPLGAIALSGVIAHRADRLGLSILVAIIAVGLLPFILCPLAYVYTGPDLDPLWLVVGAALLILGIFALQLRQWNRLVAVGLNLSYTVILISIFQADEAHLFSLGLGQALMFLLGVLLIYMSIVMQFASLKSDYRSTYTKIASMFLLSIILGSCAGANLPFMEDEAIVEAPADVGLGSEPESASPGAPRLRQYFPETLLWLPEAETNSTGLLAVDVPLADSITTWRISALASSHDGQLGNTVGGLTVFQDFFIDLDLPQALTVGDEISIPVGVFNYLPVEQEVELILDQADWFDLLDDPQKQITIGANEISSVAFRIRAVDYGFHRLRVTARGSELSDAIQKGVQVHPDGKRFAFTSSDRLEMETINLPLEFPENAISGTETVTLKIYPGIASQVVEGLDSILRMPSGCFEQTSSAAYPNIMVLDYLRASDQLSPEVQFTAENYINLGYQRLVTFEVSSGGFSLYGNPHADRMLTAYGLMEFTDMSRVYNVDPAIIERTAEWLLDEQREDGSWDNDRGFFHEPGWSDSTTGRIPSTAYILWGLVEAGYGGDARTQRGVSFLKENMSEITAPYVLALVSNALVGLDLENQDQLSPTTEVVLDELAAMASVENGEAHWASQIATYMGSRGSMADLETTALATLAFLRANRHPDLATGGLTFLIRQKDEFGSWYSTQSTVTALKALRESIRVAGDASEAVVRVSLNEGQEHTIRVTPENFDVVQIVVFDDFQPGEISELEISASGSGNLMYQISGSYFLPWGDQTGIAGDGSSGLVDIQVEYDRRTLRTDDTVGVDVSVEMVTPGSRSQSSIIDLGIPPGFSVVTQDLDALVAEGAAQYGETDLPIIERYELTGRQIILYVSNLSYDYPFEFTYHLQAKFPLVAKTPLSVVYDYYNPQINGEQAPVVLVVEPTDQ